MSVSNPPKPTPTPDNDWLTQQMPYPKWESHCHGAPVVKHTDQQPKYTCLECGDKCIARKKK